MQDIAVSWVEAPVKHAMLSFPCYNRRRCPSQIGPSPQSEYSVLANGSLLLQPVSKDHHGGWECLATNRVATVSAGTVVMVLGEGAGSISALNLHF